MIRDLFQRLKNQEVTIKCKSFGVASATEFKGMVIDYFVGQGTEMFLELSTGDIINTRYIASIKVNK